MLQFGTDQGLSPNPSPKREGLQQHIKIKYLLLPHSGKGAGGRGKLF